MKLCQNQTGYHENWSCLCFVPSLHSAGMLLLLRKKCFCKSVVNLGRISSFFLQGPSQKWQKRCGWNARRNCLLLFGNALTGSDFTEFPTADCVLQLHALGNRSGSLCCGCGWRAFRGVGICPHSHPCWASAGLLCALPASGLPATWAFVYHPGTGVLLQCIWTQSHQES